MWRPRHDQVIKHDTPSYLIITKVNIPLQEHLKNTELAMLFYYSFSTKQRSNALGRIIHIWIISKRDITKPIMVPAPAYTCKQ